ncbi:MAG: radical SAM protein, partial [Spirochaetales bacterium]|nr:radical SAM protein [Spirochaetales bacterium]
MNLFDYTRQEMVSLMEERYGKGAWHGEGLFSHLYEKGSLEGLENHRAFRANPALAEQIQRDGNCTLPELAAETGDEGTVKALLNYPSGGSSESVFIPMHGHNTLCVSSQVGCKRGCTFCRTARMGLIRNLTAGEIVAQVMHHLFREKREIRNIVFMGMGEPLDNFDHVIRAVDILSDGKGIGLLKRFISLSTCGNGEGLDRLARLIQEKPEESYNTLRLAVSINGADNELRSRMMPVNRIWPLEELKKSLLRLPQSQKKDRLYFEYVLIQGVNDSRKDADNLLNFL